MGDPPNDHSNGERQCLLEPIAICGMSMRLPGGVRDAHSFWDALVQKKDLRCPVPADRFNADGFYSQWGKPGTMITREAYYLNDEELGHVDSSFFRVPSQELPHLDPQGKILLEITQECLENAGEIAWRGQRVGCYVGTFGEDWVELGRKDTEDMTAYRIAGGSDFALSNRLSYEYDFRGPSMTIKSACSSAMMCLNEACWAISNGLCDSAVVAGSNLIVSPTLTTAMSVALLSPTGSCKSFDAAADGYARGEAINCVYIKRLSDAIQAGNPIRSVIRGIGVNSNGQTSVLTGLSQTSQETLIRAVYRSTGLPLHQTGYFECHGTGTRSGDPIEANVVGKLFGDAPGGIYIGSVKPNFGHGEGASAITSIIKGTLALEKRAIPPNMHFATPNPSIDFSGLIVPTEVTPWPSNRAHRISLNSFGITGANGHVILESADSWFDGASTQILQRQLTSSRLLVLSATHKDSLARLKETYTALATQQSIDMDNLAYTLGARRLHHKYRSICTMVEGDKEPSFSPSAQVLKSSQTVFVFSGQGVAWPRMGAEFLTENAIFLKKLKVLDTNLSSQGCTFSLQEELFRDTAQSRIHEAEISQPLSTAIQMCLCDALSAVGVIPAAVIGHSSGEIAAAYAAGALTAKQAITVAFLRGQVLKSQKSRSPGAMVSVGLGKDIVLTLPLHGTVLAADNSPVNVTLSGSQSEIEAAIDEIEDRYPDCLIRRLKVENAYHSHYMQSVSQRYEAVLRDIIPGTRSTMEIPFFSTLLGRQLGECESLDPNYWRRHMECPVLFREGVEQVLSTMKDNLIFAEIGPHPTLAASLIQTAAAAERTADVSYVSFMRRSSSTMETFHRGLGKLYELGAAIDFEALNPTGKVLTDLPNYSWQHDNRHWSESRLSQEWRFRKYPSHDLLGVKVVESTNIEPSWRKVLRVGDVEWLRDHQLGQDMVMPLTGFCSMIGEAIQQVHHVRSGFTLRHVVPRTPLVLSQTEGHAVEIITTLQRARLTDSLDSAWSEFTICSFSGSQWIKHCTGSVRLGREPSTHTEESKVAPGARKIESRTWYQAMGRIGFNYGPRFKGLQAISASAHSKKYEATAIIEDQRSEQESPYQLHPGTIDCALQLVGIAALRGLTRDMRYLLIPSSLEELYIESTSQQIALGARAEITSTAVKSGEVTGYAGGSLVLHLQGLRLSLLDASSREQDPDPHAAAELIWLPDVKLSSSPQLSKFCSTQPGQTSLAEMIRLVAHSNPLLSILEFGDDTSDERIPNYLGDTGYSAYTVAHFDEDHLSKSKERLKNFDRVTHVQYDMSRDLVQQDFLPGSHDLIVVTLDALDRCADLESWFKDIRQLLRPHGKMIVNAAHDVQEQSSHICLKADSTELKAMFQTSGFPQTEMLDKIIIANATPDVEASKSVVLLSVSGDDSITGEVSSIFEGHGVRISVLTLDNMEAKSLAGQPVVSITDLQGKPTLKNLSSLQLEHLKQLFQSSEHGLLWLTKPSQLGDCLDPNYGMILGLARTVRTELQTDLYTLELSDHKAPGASEAIWKVFGQMSRDIGQHESGNDILDPDYEYAFYNGCLHIPRFHWTSTRKALIQGHKETMENDDVQILKVGTHGRLDSLHWTTRKLPPLKPHQLQIRIKAVGVNFKDVLTGMGLVDVNEEGLGLEGSGVVEHVGDDVTEYKVGDRVVFCGKPAYATHIRNDAMLCSKIADNIGFEEAATMPVCFLTAMHGLIDLARLQKGESVLIHSGCGGVGIAAIQLAQTIGAEIFATVGSEAKVQHLVENFGIPRDHIFNSRNASFYVDIMQYTSGRGVDVVLNSLAGELLHASWKCVASFGRMIEIGKRDIVEYGKLDMIPFAENKTYCSLSLGDIFDERPLIPKGLFTRLEGLLQQGLVKPIGPITTFAATAVEECFRHMQKGQHIGKLIVQLPDDLSSLPLANPNMTLRLDPTASFLIVGGFGGIGRSVARYMVESGAENLVFLSRAAGTKPDHMDFMDELRAMGCSCRAIAGDVVDQAMINQLIATTVPPIKGVVQASMVLKDQSLMNMPLEDWNTVVNPKVQGTWNLHNALSGARSDLDFFIVLGSISGIIGSPGQSNYSAANTFLDAFVKYRHGLRLPASVLDIGLVGDIGVLSDRPDLLHRMQNVGAYTLYEQEILDAFHWALNNSKPWLQGDNYLQRGSPSLGLRSTIALQDPNNFLPWKRDRRMALYHNSAYNSSDAAPKSQGAATASSQQLLEVMKKIRADPHKELADPVTARILAQEAGKKAFKMLLRSEDELDINMSMSDAGMDSLIAIEMKRWWRDAFEMEVSVLQLANVATFKDLGDLAVDLLKRKWLKDTTS